MGAGYHHLDTPVGYGVSYRLLSRWGGAGMVEGVGIRGGDGQQRHEALITLQDSRGPAGSRGCLSETAPRRCPSVGRREIVL